MKSSKVSEIKAYLEEQGAQGVNAISKRIGIPLSTVQKYMHSQSYFVFTKDRKWDIPNHVINNQTMSNLNTFSDTIDTQLTGIESLATLLINNISSTITLMKAQKDSFAPVADFSAEVHPSLQELDKNIQNTDMVFKKYMSAIPDKYKELFKNLDIYRLTIEKGIEYLNAGFNSEISSLLLERTDELSDEVIDVLKNYQKEI